jgi:hypothetical protein
MNENGVLVAIEAALRSPAFCACGESLDLVAHDEALWLECRTYAKPSRLPAPVIAFLREGFHDRRHVADLPSPEAAEAPSEHSARPIGAARTVATGA